MRNIVLITLDSVRADHCSFMGYHRETTPTLDKMARRGLYFENAVAPAPRTLFSMAQIFTGQYIVFTDIKKTKGLTELANARKHLKKHKTIPEMLKTMGYATGAFCPNAYTSRYFGFDKGFDYFQDFMFTDKFYQKIFSKMIKEGSKVGALIRNIRNFIFKQEVFKTWESYYGDIINWVDKTKEPFFLWIFLLDTHLPWIVPKKYRININLFEMYYYNFKLVKLLEKQKYEEYSEKFIQKLINLYDSSIKYADEFIKNIIKDLNDYDPIFVIHSDHGEEFGERGYFGHFYPHLYEENIHVPLIVYNTDERYKVKEPFSLLNLSSIVLSLADNSLSVEFIKNILKNNIYVISKDYNHVSGQLVMSVRMGNWKYIIGQKDIDELYNLRSDPNEKLNLINEYPMLVENLRKIVKLLVNREIEMRKIYKISLRMRGSV